MLYSGGPFNAAGGVWQVNISAFVQKNSNDAA